MSVSVDRRPIILPNDTMNVYASDTWSTDATVIASSVYNDDGPLIQTLLVMHREPPYFQAVLYNPDAGMVAAETSARVSNIGEAVQAYEDLGGEVA